MTKAVKQLLFWTPRILCILFAVLVSLFALDVFGEGHSFWKTILALLIHLIPTGIIIVVLAVSWRWEWVGAILFSVLGVLYIVTFWWRVKWPVYFIVAGPLFLVGFLFLINWLYRKQIRAIS